jgi:DNA-binding PadR family transcriptional regulator
MAATKNSDPHHHIPMHPVEFQTLLVLMDGELHGYGIAKEIEGRETGLGKIFPTNLYRRLRDMAEKGLISEAEEADAAQRRLFSISGFGKAVARAEAERMEALVLSARQHSLLPSSSTEG